MLELWMAPHTTFAEALQSLSQRCDDMGLVSPSETCKRDIWCVWVACRTPPGMRPVEDATECLRQKDAIGQELAMLRARFRLPHHGRVQHYPDNPQDLSTMDKLVWDKAYPIDAPPVPCPLNETIIFMLQQKLPCRVSHHAISQPTRPVRRQRSGLGQSMALGLADGMHEAGD
eukprot:2176722-Pyramimonas_sp.AAC.1